MNIQPGDVVAYLGHAEATARVLARVNGGIQR